jgi:hypothetical protein
MWPKAKEVSFEHLRKITLHCYGIDELEQLGKILDNVPSVEVISVTVTGKFTVIHTFSTRRLMQLQL